MGASLRHLTLAACIGLPLLWSLAGALASAADAAAWWRLWHDPQLPRALALTLFTGVTATALSVLGAAFILRHAFPGRHWQPMVTRLGAMLALPHAAFAIGFAFLIAPSGWLLRLFSPWATGFDAPPAWTTTQDPWGLSLVAVLVAKEVPFLLWAAATQLQRPDVAQRLAREWALAQTMGYATGRAWWRVLWPQIWPRLYAPVLAVWVYSLTVVDMAIVIGPGTPPVLAALAAQWLMDADPWVSAQGAAAAWLLAMLVALCLLLLRWLRPLWAGGLRRRRSDGQRGRAQPANAGMRMGTTAARAVLPVLYGLVAAFLALGSVAGVWPFPQLWPQSLSLQAWQSVLGSSSTLWLSAGLGLAAAMTALLWSVAWLECAPAAWDAALRRLLYLPLWLPSVLWVLGIHRLTLHWGWDAQFAGLWLAHTLAATPYVLIALSPAYLGFDPRLAQIAATLGHSRAQFLWRIKWPLLRASLCSALAVGFAVSMAQYLPTLFVGAGRFSTVTTEAVTLASGAQRSLSSAYAWLQLLLPACMFALMALLGRPRRFARQALPAGSPGGGAS